ncbi:MAG TPA: ribosome biogenesis GTP-binding protein YihA/YsxC [Polyangiaceae bacterium]|nr:ribosome biogenesis GTP-binding protein YihA/YsxC [Polyangiaceae bacterium]
MKPRAEPSTTVVDASFEAGSTDARSLPPPTLLEVALAGRSNVGKSSLLNTLMQRRGLARTSGTPGCTRQLNMFQVRCSDGLTLRLVDLPGYGWAQRSRHERGQWQAMVERYLAHRVSLRAIVLVVDVRRGPGDDETQLVDFVRQAGAPGGGRPIDVIWVATKLDKIAVAARKPALARLRRAAHAPVIGFSAKDASGREELWQRIRGAILGGPLAGASIVG